ncbi:MAG: hypothetical protein RL701_4468 [Pseudomonadota bacterium]
MNTRVAITHRIEQRFDHPVRMSTHWLRLRPAPQTRAAITAYSLHVNTQPHFLNWVRDPFENYLARLDLPEPVTALDIELEMIAELEPVNPFDFLTEGDAFEHPFEYPEQLQKELVPYLARTEPGPRLLKWLAKLERAAVPTVERLTAVNRQVHAALAFAADGGTGNSLCIVDPEVLLTQRRASTWELAWLLTESLRHLGIAARFVSGHRVLLAAEPALDKVSVHAWSEAYVPGAGWIGLDPAAGLFTNETYIPFACAPELLRVRPLVGYREACEEVARETLTVRRLEPTESRFPYTPTQWSDIRALGEHVQRDLARQGVNASIGGRLSFVSGVYVDAPEWNNVAIGNSKRNAAESLLDSLRLRLGDGGVPHLGQGEWFSGEALPRWRLSCFFRSDGAPVWRNPERLGWGRPSQRLRAADTHAFAEAVTRALGISTQHLVDALEDPLHELWRGRSHGMHAPSASDLADAQGRKHLAERLSQLQTQQERGEPTGYVLPLAWDHASQSFRSGPWSFRRQGLYLAPGASPLGYRLPLAALPADQQSVIEAQLERDAFEERAWLTDLHELTTARLSAAQAPARNESARMPRTALCVQAREGALYVFLPPVSHLEHYLELVCAVEAASEATGLPVILEGYEPPEDPRLRRFVLEPDAGVLRLTLPETDNWRAHLDVLQAAYEEATRAGLSAQRILLDGTALPPGGGARLTLGGTRPIDSPFLRRPEILRSLIAYWQRHPCLSYFFSGRLVGAGGPAPRPDEGRDEAIYELSLALSRLGDDQDPGLWHADRLLRHLLTDLTGDLKRAEIRVDQLYAPERASKRLGRVEIGSFETAPHAHVAALQSLLTLGLLGHFARTPDSGKLERWGTAIHDRFMLPHILWDDLRSVLRDLDASGYPFQLEWFESLKNQRFPTLGTVQIGTISFELQSAHEPWPLLAEEVTSDGVTRFIDAANERMQTRLSGLTPSRYALLCNGHQVPLQATGVQGEFVAGVRYKIANPPATLHPTVLPVGALVFDLIDLWTGRAIGGATYLPPQPQLWGPVGSPAVPEPPTTAGNKPAPPREPLLPYLSLAPLSGNGRFLPHGSGLKELPVPPLYRDEEYPYLLDLTHRA